METIESRLENTRIDCGWCGAPHAKLWEGVYDCPLLKPQIEQNTKNGKAKIS